MRLEPFSRVERNFSRANTDSTTVFVRLMPLSLARSSGVIFSGEKAPPLWKSMVCA